MLGRGQINGLDDTVVTYCPGFSMMTDYNITLKQLASQVYSYSYYSYIASFRSAYGSLM